MCGLLGFAATKGTKIEPQLAGYILNQLQLLNEQRGGDSFGLGVVSPDDKDARLYKTVGKISKLGGNASTWRSGVLRVMRHVYEGKSVAALGHNRLATVGANSERNAHPFLCGKPDREDFVIGAHNGSIGMWMDVGYQWDTPRRKQMEVDSEVIFRGLQKFHEEPNVEQKVIGSLIATPGSMALTYMMSLERIRFFKGSNPLRVAVGPGFAFWSSRKDHLEKALFGLNLEIKWLDKNGLYTYDLRDGGFRKVRTIKEDKALFDKIKPAYQKTFRRPKKRGGDRKGGAGSSSIYTDNIWENRKKRQTSSDELLDAQRELLGAEGTEEDAEDVEDGLPYGEASGTDACDDDADCSSGDSDSGLGRYRLVEEDFDASIKTQLYLIKGQTQGKCDLCKNDEGEVWEYLHHRGDSLCPICYYYMIMHDAEENMGEVLDPRNRR